MTACSLSPTLKNTSCANSKKMPSIKELLAQKAKADEEFQALLAEVWKKEVEEKERVEENRRRRRQKRRG